MFPAALCVFVLLLGSFVRGAADAGISVSVSASTGSDTALCGVSFPCKTIAYAVHARQAAALLLSNDTFSEPTVFVNASVSISGVFGGTVFDCSGRAGSALVITGASVAVTNVTFQHCTNFGALNGMGGALSATLSSVTVVSCTFVNNSAQSGGAVGVISSSLFVSSSLFQRNSATCYAATACAAWGGAISADETLAVTLTDSRFFDNAVIAEPAALGDLSSQASAGGGCVSVLFRDGAVDHRVMIDGNVFESCFVRMAGFMPSGLQSDPPSGVQYGSTFGGAVSLYYGLRTTSSLVVANASFSFTDNACHRSGVITGVGRAGSAYGGCLSVYAGPWIVNAQAGAVVGPMTVHSMRVNISGNGITQCSATAHLRSARSNGLNAYGGGVSIALGAYSYGQESSSVVGSTTVSDGSFVISSNVFTSCNATSSSESNSNGASTYGGCVSFVAGAYSYSSNGSAVAGSTAVNRISVIFSRNALTGCTASSSSHHSVGVSSFGGGLSLVTGSYSFSNGGRSTVSGDTVVSSGSFTVAGNVFTGCSALSVSRDDSNGLNSYGGGVSFAVGVYSYSIDGSFVSGSTVVNDSSYNISSNTLTACNSTSSSARSSFGANAYGGCFSFRAGSYSYGIGISIVSSNIAVFNLSHTVYENAFTACVAQSLSGSFSYGADAYGGGVSLVVGAYSYSLNAPSHVSNHTVISNCSFSLLNNVLISCSAMSLSARTILGKSYDGGSFAGCNLYSSPRSSNGANVHGGAAAYVVSDYSYGMNSSLEGSATVVSSSFIISGNSFADCSATSSTRSDSNGANSYGGGLALVIGTYSYALNMYSSVSKRILITSTVQRIYGNALVGCTSASSSASSHGAGTRGGGISIVTGVYSYSGVPKDGISSYSHVSSDIAISDSSCDVSNNELINCSAFASSRSSSGLHSYGGAVSLSLGAYSYSGFCSDSASNVVGGLRVSAFQVLLYNTSIANCSSMSHTVLTAQDSVAAGGAVSVVYESYVFPKGRSLASPATLLSSRVAVSLCSFSACFASTASSMCSAGASNAAGGALFVSAPDASVAVSSSAVYDSSVSALCASTLSQTYSVGGGMAFFRAKDIAISSSRVANCAAKGALQANNVLVGGGGVFAQASRSLALDGTRVSFCSVADASSTILHSGGGAIAAHDVSDVRMSSCQFHNNSDSSSTGVIFLRQLNALGMIVNIASGSVLSMSPSISAGLPALSVSCGPYCSVDQQLRMRINVTDSFFLAQSGATTVRSATVMSVPAWSPVTSERSFVNCSFQGTEGLAVIISNSSDARSVTVNCAPCDAPFSTALTSATFSLEDFASLRRRVSCRALGVVPNASSDTQRCPFGISFCSTFVNVTVGFWADFTAEGRISDAIHCPANYCGCRNTPLPADSSACLLLPVFSPEFRDHRDDALCANNRAGVLCGGCQENFTQSLNGYSCIGNDVCQRNLVWVWAVTALGHLLYSVFVVRKSLKKSSGLTMCVLFYGQMSSFASIPPILEAQPQASAESSWLSKVTQVESVLSLLENTCYGASMGAYEATLAHLSGPAIVAVASLLLTVAANMLYARFEHVFRKRNVDIRLPFGVTMINVLLMLFSSVSSVVFQLITCVDIKRPSEATVTVVFIDGTKSCEGPRYQGLIAAAALLSLVPLVFFAGLRFERISVASRAILCSAYADSRYYWAAITLFFRFIVTVISATIPQVPSVAAMVQCICSVCMLMLVVTLRPFKDERTYCMDVFCYVCLVIQFLLQCLARASESLGVSVTRDNGIFYNVISNASTASTVIRFTPFAVCAVLLLADAARQHVSKLFERTGKCFFCWKASATIARLGSKKDVELKSQFEESHF